MVPMMSRTLRSVTLVAGLAMAALPAWGQTYPSSPVHLIVAYAAGGTGDVVARIVAPKLSTALGQSVIVENRAGASGDIGARRVVGQAFGHRARRADSCRVGRHQGFRLYAVGGSVRAARHAAGDRCAAQ